MRGKLFLTAAAFAFSAAAFAPVHAQTIADSASTDLADSAATRARLEPGAPVQGELAPAGDKDWYRLRVRSGRLYTITLQSAAEGDSEEAQEGNLADPLLRVLSADGEELAVNDDAEGSLNSRLQYAPESNGEVFVEARGFLDDATGRYILNVTEADLPPDNAGGDRRTRGRISVGDVVHGGLEFAQDRDWFRIRLREGQSYRFTLSGDDSNGEALGDPLLRLIGPDGEEIAMDDDGGAGLNSYLEIVAPSTGNYFLEARGFVEDATGGYVLTASEGDIPADFSTDAVLSADGDYRQGQLSPAGDKDWYRMDMAEGQTVRIALDGGGEAGALGDPMLIVHDSESVEVARDDDGGDGLNSLLEFTAPAAGAYFLEVRGFSEDAEGAYVITVANGEIGADPESADQIEANTEGRTSTLQTPDDVDWFAIQMVEGRPYRFNLEGVGDTPLPDPVLTLYNLNGEQVAQDDDGGPGANSYLTIASPTGGIYFAAVSAFNQNEAGVYNLRVTDTDVPGNLDTDENLDAREDDRASVIEMIGDQDAYRVELDRGSRYMINVSGDGAHPLSDPMLTIKDSEGETVAEDDNSGPGRNPRLNFTAPDSGYFYLVVSGARSSVGGYKISIARR